VIDQTIYFFPTYKFTSLIFHEANPFWEFIPPILPMIARNRTRPAAFFTINFSCL